MFEDTTSRVDFSSLSFSTDLAQIRKVGFFLAKMKIGQIFKPFNQWDLNLVLPQLILCLFEIRVKSEGGLGGRCKWQCTVTSDGNFS